MRARTRWLAPLAAGAVGALVAASCTANRGSIGDDCLKDEDCTSGVCAELTCAASPTYLDGEANLAPDAEASADGEEAADALAPDAVVEAAPDATLEAPEAAVSDTGLAESGSPDGPTPPLTDAGGEASVDAGESAMLDGGTTTGGVDASEASIDASPDAPADAPADASPDALPDALPDAHLDGASD
jgi:hypothetical protein